MKIKFDFTIEKENWLYIRNSTKNESILGIKIGIPDMHDKVTKAVNSHLVCAYLTPDNRFYFEL